MLVPKLGKVLALIQNPEDFLVAKNTGKVLMAKNTGEVLVVLRKKIKQRGITLKMKIRAKNMKHLISAK